MDRENLETNIKQSDRLMIVIALIAFWGFLAGGAAGIWYEWPGITWLIWSVWVLAFCGLAVMLEIAKRLAVLNYQMDRRT